MIRFLLPVLLLCATPVWAASPQTNSFAGTGKKGYSGDGGLAAEAQLNNVFGVVRGPDGALYICDTDNHAIRRVDRAGKITTVAGTGERGYSGDGQAATKAKLNEPYEIRFDRQGNMVFVERMNHLIRRVDAQTGIISTIAGSGRAGYAGDGQPAHTAEFNQPHSIQFDAAGNLYICDILNHRLRKIDHRTGIITTLSGTGERAPTPDGAKFVGAPLNGPRAIDFDQQGQLWLALREGNAVYRLDLEAGTIHHVAGTGKQGFTGHDGPAKAATLSGPKGVSIGPDGNVYLADTESHSIRMIDPVRSTIHLIVGTGERGDGPDGDPLKCRLARPHGIWVDADGTIFIGDSENHRVRTLQPTRP